MTKADLVSQIAIATGFDKRTVSSIVENFTGGIKRSLANGEGVFIRGFGSFVLKKRAAKVARNISARSTVFVPEHSVPSFKPAADFNEIVRDVKKNK